MEAQVLPGDMMLFRPDAHCRYGLHPRSDYWQHLWALFQPREHWTQLMQWRELDRGILVLSLPDESSRERLEKLFRELIALGDEPGPMQSDLQHNKLEEILIRARAYSAPETAVAVEPRIQQACDYMRDRLAQKFSIDEVAAACNLSTSRLAHLFKEQIGMAPKAWINDARLQQARKLLINSGDSIGGIGACVGFDDPSHFTRYFSKSMGCSPREFRKSFRGG
jgi:AraC family transcriptional regulator of arabinose operon